MFDLSFFIKKGYNNTQINTSEYYFEPVDANGLAFAPGEEQKNFAMRLNVDSASYVEYLYTISRDNYMIDFGNGRPAGAESGRSGNQLAERGASEREGLR